MTIVEIEDIRTLADDLVVIPNRGVDLVPNIGVVGGRDAVLVIDTGMGPRNAEKVLRYATGYAAGRKLFLTTTHFHPEHAFGAATFAGAATYVVNRAQADDLATRGQGYLGMFRGLGPEIAKQLDGVEIPAPDVIYDGTTDLDLGGRTVRLRATGRGHTRGDQVITVPDAGVLFTGDLVETGQFAIFPWFPPHDVDVSGLGWIDVLARLIASAPRIVVPGHGDVGGPELLTTVLDYLGLLRDETWARRDVDEVREVLIARHPEWAGREWIDRGFEALSSERDPAAVAYAELFDVPPGEVFAALSARVGPTFAAAVLRSYASGEPLTRRDRSIAIITALVAQGVTGDRLDTHVAAARREGLDDDALAGLMTVLASYVGFARASLAMESITASAA